METCPKCKSKRVHRSRTRSAVERMRRTLTGKAPFRCSECNWRGWAVDSGAQVNAHGHAVVTASEGPEPDLGEIDREMGRRDG